MEKPAKPTVFFSHSSADKVPLQRLKDSFVAKTGGTIEVFLSSDGQSIPLGRNWVYRVQEGLKGASMMMVFLSPESLSSGWVYFEAGYSHAKDIRVIPIGFLGVDLGQVKPPLGLLQGFNLTSADSLNNLVALVNEEFGHKHLLSFTHAEYEGITGSGKDTLAGVFADLATHIEELALDLDTRQLKKEPLQLLPDIEALLSARGYQHAVQERSITVRGMKMFTNESMRPSELRIRLGIAAIDRTLPVLAEVLGLARADGAKGIAFVFTFLEGSKALTETHRITANLYDTEVVLDPAGKLVFRDASFGTYNNESRASVVIRSSSTEFHAADAAALIRLLIDKAVISLPPSEFLL